METIALLTIVLCAVALAAIYAGRCYDQGVLDAMKNPQARSVQAAMRRAQKRLPDGREPVRL